MQAVPFLLTFAKKCVSPGRANVSIDYRYDEQVDMVRWTASPDAPFAIDQSGSMGPATKKADIEKGEDTKDGRMWR